MEASQESSDGKVSLFVILSKLEVSEIRIPYSFVGERLYSMRGAVTCLVTVLIVEESKKLGGNFHNCYGSYIIWVCIPQRLDLTSNGSISLTPNGDMFV